jgi:hypothetical protein
MAQGGGNAGDPSGLGAPGFGWGTDPKTGAYRYGKLGENGFLVPGTGEIPPTDPEAAHTTGNIPVTKRASSGRSGSGAGWGAGIAALVVILILVIGAVVFTSVSQISHQVGNIFGGNCVGAPRPGDQGVEIGGGKIRIHCSGGGSMIIDTGVSGVPVPPPTPSHHHHHHQNANG